MGFACVTPAHGIGEHAFHSAEIGELRSNIREMAGRKLADFNASFPVLVGRQRQQCPHFIETETQLTRPSHKRQAVNVADLVLPIAGGATGRAR